MIFQHTKLKIFFIISSSIQPLKILFTVQCPSFVNKQVLPVIPIYPIYNYIQRLLMICQHFVEQRQRFHLWFRLIQLQVEELPQQSTFHVIVYHNIYITIKTYSISNISHHLIPSLVFSLYFIFTWSWQHTQAVDPTPLLCSSPRLPPPFAVSPLFLLFLFSSFSSLFIFCPSTS